MESTTIAGLRLLFSFLFQVIVNLPLGQGFGVCSKAEVKSPSHQVTLRYLCSWGYTWVPWFFMLSGFILCAAEIQNPREVGGEILVSKSLRRWGLRSCLRHDTGSYCRPCGIERANNYVLETGVGWKAPFIHFRYLQMV